MKFSLSWLKQHLDTTASLTEICDKLTALGLEFEGIEDAGAKLKPFIIAYVATAEQHPNADRLRVTTVDTGKEKLQVVCGAPNCRAGIKVVLARPGDVMPDSGEALKKGTIRGVESQGMLCARDELGLQAEETTGIIELPDDAPVGASYAQYAGLDDPVIEINLTPNRPDCAGVRGIARDLAAAGMGMLRSLDTTAVKGTEPSRITVTIDAVTQNACPLFIGRLIRNVKNGASPAWLQQRLTSIGQRPISALVDMTNFMTFDCARPLHVFDAKKIKGNLWVRPATGGETFAALNDKEYTMQAGMTIIGDDTGTLSLAGIMGGSSSACDENTTDVFIEGAYFSPNVTARTGRALQISSDARYRFERGIDPAFTHEGIELATKLVVELCGTAESVVSDVVVAGAVPDTTRTIALNFAHCAKRTGVDVPHATQIDILQKLGFAVKVDGASCSVTTPSWRPDVEGAADLVEEIIRVYGFDKITATSLNRSSAITLPAIDVVDARQSAVRRALAAQGLMEAVTWSFMSGQIASLFGDVPEGLRLLNPISSDLDVMRPTIIANHIMAAKRNADRGFADVGLFEMGPIFRDATDKGQVAVASTLRAGHTPRHWAAPSRAYNVFDAKADALAALESAGAPVASLQVTTDAPSWYHPGRSGVLRLGPTMLAVFGEVHPEILAACGADAPMVACEIFVNNIPQPRASGTAKPLLKAESLQPLSRDFAFVVAKNVTAAKLVRAIKDADKNLIRDVQVFDVYEGEHVAAGMKSVAVSVILQPTEKTLTDAEIDTTVQNITRTVEKATGATLRG